LYLEKEAFDPVYLIVANGAQEILELREAKGLGCAWWVLSTFLF